MKTLFQTSLKFAAVMLLLIGGAAITARAQGARLQIDQLDSLANRASETVDVKLDEHLIGTAAKIFSEKDDADAVVNAIEQFYHVKHQSLPLLARAGIKGARTVARIRGGDYKRIADAGSVRLVFFEDQEFNSQGRIAGFRASIQNALNESWSPLIATLSAKDEEQTY